MIKILEKVTVFIVRKVAQEYQLLLFEHPVTGVQIPAGIVEVQETPEASARREAQEKTGMRGFTAPLYLGSSESELVTGYKVLGTNTSLYARPTTASPSYAYLSRGLPVAVLREASGFTQVTCQEPPPIGAETMALTYITGWIASQTLAYDCLRHFFVTTYPIPCNDSWRIFTQQYWHTLFWAPMEKLPPVLATQTSWLSFLDKQLLDTLRI
ncbi:MAG: NUDIX domain-containing protein [Caldilineaceae bacterium]|nr:NUDIX domain-containing protein [Caldilineaceae bacterium]